MIEPTPYAVSPVISPLLAGVRAVVHHRRDPRLPEDGHRVATVKALAARIAALRGEPVADLAAGGARHYAVPDATILADDAAQLGLQSEADLFGGVVGAPYMAGKAISLPLLGREAAAPDAWAPDFAQAVADATLLGLTAFTSADAEESARRLLAHGPVRLKPAWADGGLDQIVVREARDLPAALAGMSADAMARCGLVVEQNLADPITYSVGAVVVGDQSIAYVGTQGNTRANDGTEAYGGSRLYVVRGTFDDLLAREMPAPMRAAAERARLYDRAADQHLAGFFASRRNYDVVIGRDPKGREAAGVLEQSWRIGGASGAELLAMKRLTEDPTIEAVIASSVEVYGKEARVPPDADVYYQGEDPVVGHLTKYAIIETGAHA